MAATGDTNWFLLFSDVHFDPFADTSLVKALASSDAASWKSLLASSKQTAYPAYGSDSNYALFESALDSMAEKAGDVSTIIYPGDLLAHDFNQQYATLTGDKSRTGVESFIQKTVGFFVQEVKSRFPHATVLVTDGNTDSALDEIGSRPGDPYLALSAPIFSQAFFTTPEDRAAFTAGWSAGGYYAVEPHGESGLKYIVLNDNLWFPQPFGDFAAGQAELAWFTSELADSARNSQQVYVIAHVPVGANAEGVANTAAQTGRVAYSGFLDDSFDNALATLELTYSSTIAATFAGHTHDDDFRIISSPVVPGASELVRIAPGITPYLGNNPGYQVYSYDTRDFRLLDETTYALNLQASAPAWSKEYDYAETYGRGLATPQDWRAVYDGIQTDPLLFNAYATYNNQGAASRNPITAANASIYQLAIGHTTSAGFNAAALSGVPG